METTALIVLCGSFVILLVLGLPVAYSIGLAACAALLVLFPANVAASVLAQKMITALDSFGLLAIPFFILAGNLMNSGGIARRMIELARVIGGPLPGALAHVNVLANMIFGSISGSAVSAAAAVGGIMAPVQKREGMDPNFTAAVNIASSPSGLLIPPSGALILFSLVSGGTSVAALFVAGYLPGILWGIGIMAVVAILALRRGYSAHAKIARGVALRNLFAAVPGLFLVIVVIGGIIVGAFTATEASAVAVVYSLALGLLYRELRPRDLPAIFFNSVLTTGIVLFLVGSSMAMSWVLAAAELPAWISSALKPVADNRVALLLILNVMVLVIGTFMDMTPALLILTPVLLPLAQNIGMHPVHFGIMLVFNLCIGICTPPVGSVLFVGASIGGVEIKNVLAHLLPMYAALVLVLLLVTFVPELSLFLPRLLGLIE